MATKRFKYGSEDTDLLIWKLQKNDYILYRANLKTHFDALKDNQFQYRILFSTNT